MHVATGPWLCRTNIFMEMGKASVCLDCSGHTRCCAKGSSRAYRELVGATVNSGWEANSGHRTPVFVGSPMKSR